MDTFVWWLLTLWTWIKTNFVGKMGKAICRNETRKCYKGILAVQWFCNWVLTHMICKYHAMFANFGWKILSLKFWFWLIFRKYFSKIFCAFFLRKEKQSISNCLFGNKTSAYISMFINLQSQQNLSRCNIQVRDDFTLEWILTFLHFRKCSKMSSYWIFVMAKFSEHIPTFNRTTVA